MHIQFMSCVQGVARRNGIAQNRVTRGHITYLRNQATRIHANLSKKKCYENSGNVLNDRMQNNF